MTIATPSHELDGDITVRRAETLADYRACQEVQRKAWGVSDEGYLVPIATMVGANLHGGLTLGAFLPGGEAVAMSFAFLGRIEGRLSLYSQLTGVVPEYQSRGLGYAIKMRQREIAHSEGLETIAWAFDPLQSGNAHFNLSRLGATAGRYVENMYGLRTDALNAGVPTDRLIVEWETTPHASAGRPSYEPSLSPRLIETARGREGELDMPLELSDSARKAQRVFLEVPDDIGRLRRENPGLAEHWRAIVAQSFQTAFAARFRAIHFVRDDTSGRRRGFYVMERL